jgi:small subunit ribosomal protein S8
MDPISDMLIRIKNAGLSRKASVMIPYSRMKIDIVSLLEREGFVGSVSKKSRRGKKMIDVFLMYSADGAPKVKGVKRISKPSRRIYNKLKDIKEVKMGNGRIVLSTSEGILTGEQARNGKMGGEALFEVW